MLSSLRVICLYLFATPLLVFSLNRVVDLRPGQPTLFPIVIIGDFLNDKIQSRTLQGWETRSGVAPIEVESPGKIYAE